VGVAVVVLQELLRRKEQLQQLLTRAAEVEAAVHRDSHEYGRDMEPSCAGSDTTATRVQPAAAAAAAAMAAVMMAVRAAGSDSSSNDSRRRKEESLKEDHPFACAAIWQIPALPLFYSAERPMAKELAKQLSSALTSATAI